MGPDETVLRTSLAVPGFARSSSSPKQIPRLFQRISQWTLAGFLAVASYFAASRFVCQAVRVDGLSMSPTLQDSQLLLLKRWAYLFHAPHRNDVIVLRDPVVHSFAVKRIIATSGEWVCLKSGKVYINGKPLDEPYLPAGTPTFSYSKCGDQAFKCGDDEYFVLGDNRGISADSRVYGPISRHNILGLITP